MSRLPTILVAPVLITAACVEPWYPDLVTDSTQGFLVVDGYLDGTSKTGTVKLSRTVMLGEYRDSPPETDAIVTIEDDAQHLVGLSETSDGLYEASDLDVSGTSKYRLHVKTHDGSTYSSEAIGLKTSPTFDSLVWRAYEDALVFYANAHDDSDQTHYYHYRVRETWKYRVPFESRYKIGPSGFPVKRKDDEFITFCWKSVGGTDIVIDATRPGDDVVGMFPVHSVQRGSRSLSIMYSLWVQQRAISLEEYNFLDMIQRTSENLGGLFDAIPSPVLGNIHNDDNSSESVLGYFSGGFPNEKRIFISYEELPKNLRYLDGLGYDCSIQTLTLGKESPGNATIFIDVSDPSINQYYVSTPNCADCRSLGGETTKPSFWPQ